MNITDFLNSFIKYADNNAFCIDENYYTYSDFLKRINGIRLLVSSKIPAEDKNVALVANDDIDTYASIFALWFEGKTYVPLLFNAPQERNVQVVTEAGCNYVISSKDVSQILPCKIINSSEAINEEKIAPVIDNPTNNAYILFTSGSTGKPKGVPIRLENIFALIESVENAGDALYASDRVLEMFELTFDLSVISFVHPLLRGACVYTIPKGEVKNLYIMDLIDMHQLTVMLLVPSVISLLKPYYSEIHSESVRLCSFCGEALLLDSVNEWRQCIPNARIRNYYGPTEDTVYCTYYDVDDNHQKSYNGAVSIGKSLDSGSCIIVDTDKSKTEILPRGEKGELCLAGKQLTIGYWNNDAKTQEAFFELNGTTYYRTGDLCFEDQDGDIMYSGRLDFQTKIQGFRVELSEIEHFANEATANSVVCVAFTNKLNTSEIGMVVESDSDCDTDAIINHISNHLPSYEVPTAIRVISSFPLNDNGKINRKELKKLFENE